MQSWIAPKRPNLNEVSFHIVILIYLECGWTRASKTLKNGVTLPPTHCLFYEIMNHWGIEGRRLPYRIARMFVLFPWVTVPVFCSSWGVCSMKLYICLVMEIVYRVSSEEIKRKMPSFHSEKINQNGWHFLF